MLIAVGLTQGYHPVARGIIELVVFFVHLKTFMIGKEWL